jgi:hypothetical protein
MPKYVCLFFLVKEGDTNRHMDGGAMPLLFSLSLSLCACVRVCVCVTRCDIPCTGNPSNCIVWYHPLWGNPKGDLG